MPIDRNEIECWRLGGLGGGGLGFVAIVSAPRIYASGAHGEAQIPSLDGSGLF